MRAKRGTAPVRPGTERQASQPSTFSSASGSMTGLMSTVIGTPSGGALGRYFEDDDAPGDMHLGRGKADATDILQRLQHVAHEAADFRRRGIHHRVGDPAQDGMAHAGDLQDGHGRNMVDPARLRHENSINRANPATYSPSQFPNPVLVVCPILNGVPRAYRA